MVHFIKLSIMLCDALKKGHYIRSIFIIIGTWTQYDIRYATEKVENSIM